MNQFTIIRVIRVKVSGCINECKYFCTDEDSISYLKSVADRKAKMFGAKSARSLYVVGRSGSYRLSEEGQTLRRSMEPLSVQVSKVNIPVPETETLVTCNGTMNQAGICNKCGLPAMTSSNQCGRLIPYVPSTIFLAEFILVHKAVCPLYVDFQPIPPSAHTASTHRLINASNRSEATEKAHKYLYHNQAPNGEWKDWACFQITITEPIT